MRRQNSSTPNLVKICWGVLQLIRRCGGDNSYVWNVSLQLYKKVVNNSRLTVTFSSRVADVTVHVLNYVANCLQIVYTLPHIPFKCRKTFILCMKREDQQDATIRCLLLTSVSTCFGHHYAHLQENKGPVTAFGVMFWYCWMWLVAVVGRCLEGCEH